ncbi:hypothetical protein Droror1_Dr00025379 [Drosera rotundifolia]
MVSNAAHQLPVSASGLRGQHAASIESRSDVDAGVSAGSLFADQDKAKETCATQETGQKSGTSCIQGSRKSQRIQEAVGTEPIPNLADGTHVMVAQSSRLPAPPTVENNKYCTPPNVEGSMGSNSTPIAKCVRGPTRGINVDKLRKRLGHPIHVEVDRSSITIVEEYATSVANAWKEIKLLEGVWNSKEHLCYKITSSVKFEGSFSSTGHD